MEHRTPKFESRIPDPIFSFRIPDPRFTRFRKPYQHQGIFNPKTDSKFSKIRSGMFIPDPGSGFLFHPRSRGQKGSGSRIHLTNISIEITKRVTVHPSSTTLLNTNIPGSETEKKYERE
jgi:hypothetical protein